MTYLEQKYERNRVILGLRNNFLPDYRVDERTIIYQNDLIQKVVKLGKCEQLQLPIYEIYHSSKDARVGLTKEALKIIKGDGYTGQALFLFIPQNPTQYRISLITYDWVQQECSNPRRFSFLVGENAKIHTANKQLTGKVHTREELLKRFSIEVVNDAFYGEISKHFNELIENIKHPKGVNDTDEGFKRLQNFAVRLIGRLVFCWFLKKKHRQDGSQLISEGLLSSEAVSECDGNYYHDILEPLFFETLNKPVDQRREKCQKGYYKDIPFLNGGLFNPDTDDCYKLNDLEQSEYYKSLKIENSWFESLFKVFELYNFTIDENTSTDIELSIDPEMLGRIFENLLAAVNPETEESLRNQTGSFYTPREIVDYMVTQSLKQYLYTKTDIDHKKIDSLFELEHKLETPEEKEQIYEALFAIKALDPAVGSGAFPMGILQKIMAILNLIDSKGEIYNKKNYEIKNLTLRKINYEHKSQLIKNCIYGIDIQTIAIEICRLRFFLTLIIDEEEDHIKPLPNLEFTFVCANSLIPLPKQEDGFFNNEDLIKKLKEIREKYFNSYGKDKKDLQNEFSNIQLKLFNKRLSQGKQNLLIEDPRFKKQESKNTNNDMIDMLSTWKPFENSSTGWFDSFWMFCVQDGFDIVIGNPPYVSNKGVSKEDKKKYISIYDRSDDLYNYFFIRGMELLKRNCTLVYITSDTFLTLQSKLNIRQLSQKNKIIELIKTDNVFKGVVVSPIISIIKKVNDESDYSFIFKDAVANFFNPIKKEIKISVYRKANNNVFFYPSDINMKFYNKFNDRIKELYSQWWDKIKTASAIEKNKHDLEEYRKNLKPGDVTFLGCITEGGQGLATANNGKYIAVRKSTKRVNNIIKNRPIKLKAAIKKYKITELDNLDIYAYLDTLNESEIAHLFDNLKEKYGRDIFGQGFLYRIIEDSEIADVDMLSQDEKENGIDKSKKHYVPYDKGDQDGNRWYLDTPYAISWSKENVHFLKTNSGKKGKGMPVVRNPQFYFKEGFCWNNVLLPKNEESKYIKCRVKSKSVNDVASMSFYNKYDAISTKYLISLLNSRFIYDVLKEFINNTVNLQINDFRQLPILIPNDEQSKILEDIFDYSYELKIKQQNTNTKDPIIENNLSQKQKYLDDIILKMYIN